MGGRSLLVLGLALASCGGAEEAPAASPEARGYVITELLVLAPGAPPAGRLNAALAAFAAALPELAPQAALDAALAAGTLTVTLAAGPRGDGEACVTVAAAAAAACGPGPLAAGPLAAGPLAGGRTILPLVLGPGGPVRLPVGEVRLDLVARPDGALAGELSGQVAAAAAVRELAPLLAQVLDAAVVAAPDGARAAVILGIFDRDADGRVAPAEVAASPLVQAALAPDLDGDGDGARDALSFVVGLVARPRS